MPLCCKKKWSRLIGNSNTKLTLDFKPIEKGDAKMSRKSIEMTRRCQKHHFPLRLKAKTATELMQIDKKSGQIKQNNSIQILSEPKSATELNHFDIALSIKATSVALYLAAPSKQATFVALRLIALSFLTVNVALCLITSSVVITSAAFTTAAMWFLVASAAL